MPSSASRSAAATATGRSASTMFRSTTTRRSRSPWSVRRRRATPIRRTRARASGSTSSAICPTGPSTRPSSPRRRQPLVFVVKDEIGADVFTGMTTPRGFDPVGRAQRPGRGFLRLQRAWARTTPSPPISTRAFPSTSTPTSTISCGSMRSPISIPRAPASRSARRSRATATAARPGISASPAGRATRAISPCRAMPAEGTEAIYGEPWTCDYTLDATMGWYDAGDFGKYVVNGGISVAQMMAAYERAQEHRGDHRTECRRARCAWRQFAAHPRAGQRPLRRPRRGALGAPVLPRDDGARRASRSRA